MIFMCTFKQLHVVEANENTSVCCIRQADMWTDVTHGNFTLLAQKLLTPNIQINAPVFFENGAKLSKSSGKHATPSDFIYNIGRPRGLAWTHLPACKQWFKGLLHCLHACAVRLHLHLSFFCIY